VPAANVPLYQYSSLDPRSIAYQHSGSSPYSAARTELRRTNGEIVSRNVDRPYQEQYTFYRPSVINQELTPVPSDGRFTIRAVYLTQSIRFSEPQGIRERFGDRDFRICLNSNYSCINGGTGTGPIVASQQSSSTGTEPGGETGGRERYCGLDGELCPPVPPCTNCGQHVPPAFQRLRAHTAAMGPFFAASDIGTSASRGEIEDILDRATPTQLDGIADIVQQAYGESVYDYLSVPDRTTNSAARPSGNPAINASPFLALMAPLDYAAPGSLTPESAVLDQLLNLKDRYQAAGTTASRGSSGEPAHAGASAAIAGEMDRAQAEIAASVWPNPASERVHLRVRGGLGARITIYDARGRVVTRLATSPTSQDDVVEWDLRASGRRVSAGVYQIVLTGEAGARRSVTVTIL
jgi:hypothetical protein